nr:hypothetical protein HEP85_19310 [Streptomyces sp. RPA4-2]
MTAHPFPDDHQSNAYDHPYDHPYDLQDDPPDRYPNPYDELGALGGAGPLEDFLHEDEPETGPDGGPDGPPYEEPDEAWSPPNHRRGSAAAGTSRACRSR